MKQFQTYPILKQMEGKTIRDWFAFYHVGKSLQQRYLQEKKCLINQQPIEETQLLQQNMVLTFDLDEEIQLIPESNPIQILYEDEYLLAVEKPRNCLIHPDGNDFQHTLMNQVAGYYRKKRIHRIVRPLHRLDKETTGIVLFAKDAITEAAMNAYFEHQKITKTYFLACHGKFSVKRGTYAFGIGRDRHRQNTYRISNQNDPAITHFEVVKSDKISFVKATIETGKTHQIRVHFASQNHPLVGDARYGEAEDTVLHLHATEVCFLHPMTQEEIKIRSPHPFDWLYSDV